MKFLQQYNSRLFWGLGLAYALALMAILWILIQLSNPPTGIRFDAATQHDLSSVRCGDAIEVVLSVDVDQPNVFTIYESWVDPITLRRNRNVPLRTWYEPFGMPRTYTETIIVNVPKELTPGPWIRMVTIEGHRAHRILSYRLPLTVTEACP